MSTQHRQPHVVDDELIFKLELVKFELKLKKIEVRPFLVYRTGLVERYLEHSV